jgi:hypothetical protein
VTRSGSGPVYCSGVPREGRSTPNTEASASQAALLGPLPVPPSGVSSGPPVTLMKRLATLYEDKVLPSS